MAGADALRAIPIWIESPAGSAESLSLRRPGRRSRCRGGGSTGLRARHWGFPRRGRRLIWPCKIAGQSEKTIHFHAEYPWDSRLSGSDPGRVAQVPPAGRDRGQDPGRRCARNSRLPGCACSMHRRLRREKLDPVSEAGAAGPRRRARVMTGMDVHAFAFNEPERGSSCSTEPLEPMQEAGVVREAVLATSIDPNGAALHRLRLLVHCGEARSLDLVLAGGDVTGASAPRRHGCRADRVRERASRYRCPGRARARGSARSSSITSRQGRRACRPGACEPCFPRYRFPVFRSRGSLSLRAGTRRSIAVRDLVAARAERCGGLWPAAGSSSGERAWELLARREGVAARDGDQVARRTARRVGGGRADVRGMVHAVGFGAACA